MKRGLRVLGGDVINSIVRKIQGVPPSSFFLTLVDDADAATARATLGIVSGTTEELQDAVGAMATDSDSIDFTYDDGAGTLTADIKAAVAGDGLAHSSGVLSVNVDDSTIEINSDTLRVKDSGVTVAKLANAAKESTFNIALTSITAGQQVRLRVGFACTIIKVSILADASGDLVLDIWKDTHANAPPTDADTITGGNEPELSGAQKMEDSTLTDWTTSIAAGDWLIVNVDSVATLTEATLAIDVRRS